MTSNVLAWSVACVGSYLIGSLPFGLWLAMTRGVDLRKVGSGNIGATNVWRICGPKLGLPAFILDVLKSYVPALLGGHYLGVDGFSPSAAILVGLCAVMGHTFSPLLRFRGGKGVATALGVVLATTPLAGGLTFAVWLTTFVLTRYVSLASIVAVITAPVTAYLLGAPILAWGLYCVAASLLVYKHRSNIDRLLKGTEYKFGRKNSTVAPDGNELPEPQHSRDAPLSEETK